MKKQLIIGIFTMAFLILSGCTEDTLSNTYIAESDFQYMQYGNVAYPKIQQGDGVVYLEHEGFIYYYEEASNSVMPLCNKIDCLHDEETDEEKRKECNAYIDAYDSKLQLWEKKVGIAKCNDFIYCLNPIFALNVSQTLYRYTVDGTSKEAIYTWNSDESAILEWIIHRDVLYYVEKRYYLKNNEVVVENSVKSLDLKGINRKPKTIYVADEGLSVSCIDGLQAYGNYFYFQIISYWKDEVDMVSEEDPYRYLYEKTFVYDTENENLKDIQIQEVSSSNSITGIQFWQDKIILQPYDYAKEENAPSTVYIAELDGSNPEVFIENVSQVSYFLSDGEYLYLFDDWMPDVDDWINNPGTYTVYDKDLNLIDTFIAPCIDDGKPERMPIGTKESLYHIYDEQENDEWGLLYWDKSNIGNYQGEVFSMEKIPY